MTSPLETVRAELEVLPTLAEKGSKALATNSARTALQALEEVERDADDRLFGKLLAMPELRALDPGGDHLTSEELVRLGIDALRAEVAELRALNQGLPIGPWQAEIQRLRAENERLQRDLSRTIEERNAATETALEVERLKAEVESLRGRHE